MSDFEILKYYQQLLVEILVEHGKDIEWLKPIKGYKNGTHCTVRNRH